MNIPNVPTDNLYKFVALSGLVLAGFSFVFPSVKISEVEAQQIVFSTESELLNAESKWLAEDAESLKETINQNRKSIAVLGKKIDKIRSSKELEQRTELLERMQVEITQAVKESGELQEKDREMHRKQIAANGKLALQEQIIKEIRSYFWAMIAGAGTGTGMAYWGFFMWYKRVQKPTDIELEQKIKDKAPTPRRLLKRNVDKRRR